MVPLIDNKGTIDMILSLERIEAYINGELSCAEKADIEKILAEDRMSKDVYDLLSSDLSDCDEEVCNNIDINSIANSFAERMHPDCGGSYFPHNTNFASPTVFAAMQEGSLQNYSSEFESLANLAVSYFEQHFDHFYDIGNDGPGELDSSRALDLASEI